MPNYYIPQRMNYEFMLVKHFRYKSVVILSSEKTWKTHYSERLSLIKSNALERESVISSVIQWVDGVSQSVSESTELVSQSVGRRSQSVSQSVSQFIFISLSSIKLVSPFLS
jgi:hypothetical protein